MTINNKKISATQLAFDGCHKIYLIEDNTDLEEAKKLGYEIHDISKLEQIYKNSCELRFISNWKLTERYAEQCEIAKIEL